MASSLMNKAHWYLLLCTTAEQLPSGFVIFIRVPKWYSYKMTAWVVPGKDAHVITTLSHLRSKGNAIA